MRVFDLRSEKRKRFSRLWCVEWLLDNIEENGLDRKKIMCDGKAIKGKEFAFNGKTIGKAQPPTDWEVTLQSYSDNHIDVVVTGGAGKLAWRFTGFYGHPKVPDRHLSWDLLRSLGNHTNQVWIIGGDYNEVTSQDDKEGGCLRNIRQIEGLTNALAACKLSEIAWEGPRFTWHGIRAGHVIKTRLDRFTATEQWRDVFPASRVTHLDPSESDHLPILLRLGSRRRRRRRGRFKFESWWTNDRECRSVVEKAWQGCMEVDPIYLMQQKLSTTRDDLACWSQRKFSDLSMQISRVRKQLATHYESGSDDIDAKHELEERLSSLLLNEQKFWKQRAKLFWLRDGDANTRYFHQSVKERRRRNHIQGLYDENRRWQEDGNKLEEIVIGYFTNIFTSSNHVVSDGSLDGITRLVTEEDNLLLSKEIENEEVFQALKQMHPLKAPGPDGFSPGFYRTYWDIVGSDVVEGIKSFLADPMRLAAINRTHIALIPKTASPESMSQLRPISLCNVVYKLASKVLANRMKPLMEKIISPTQSAFVPNRLITDNALLAFEVSHCIDHRRRGKKGYCSIKLDMSKAYDRVEWTFLELVMKKLGFCDRWVSMIMGCVSTVAYSVILNGVPRGNIRPSRGLRQGDALSPYMFLFCGELLTSLFTKAEERGLLEGVKICKSAPSISHIFFADDALIFAVAETTSCVTIQATLREYERVTGHVVNYSKSGISFSPNVEMQVQEYLVELLGMVRVDNHQTYLGMPLSIDRSRTRSFEYLVDRMRKRIGGWQSRMLSLAGKETLLKSVAQAVPAYVMGCFELPKHTCNEFHRLMAGFWWGDKDEKRKTHWLAWDKLCYPKRDGGLGFRAMHEFNLAMLAKQGWRLIRNPSSLVARTLKARYYPSDFMQAETGAGSSATWKSVIAGRRVLENGLRFRVGDGKSISVWKDLWVPRPHKFRPFSLCPPGLQSLTVEKLLLQEPRSWDNHMVKSIFIEEEASMILRIPLGRTSLPDEYLWHYDKYGRYSVRSGYWALRNAVAAPSRASSSSTNGGGVMADSWKFIWKLNLPPKARMFCWRLLSNILPVRGRLMEKRIHVDELSCVICGKGIEDVNHLFRFCKKTKEVWNYLGLHGLPDVLPSHAWLWEVMATNDSIKLELLFASMWGIWFYRNKALHEGLSFDAYGVSRWVLQTLQEYKSVHHRMHKGQQRPHTKWDGPPRGRLKINFDGGFDASSFCGGLGVIVRDERGVGIAAVAKPIKYASSALEMEAEACKLGLQLGLDQGWDDIDIEGDSIQLMAALQSEREDLSEVGLVIDECRKLLVGFKNITLRHIYREANGVAHRLAHFAKLQGLENVWIDEIPVIIQDVLFEDQCNMPSSSRIGGFIFHPELCTNVPNLNNNQTDPST